MNFDDVRAAILSGEFDKQLLLLGQAFTERMTSDDGPTIRWRLTIEGVEVTEEDITLAETKLVERLTGQTWLTAKPGDSAAVTSAFLVVALKRTGLTLEEATSKVDDMTSVAVAACFDQYQSDPPTGPAGS